MEMDSLKYPIGKFEKPTNIGQELIAQWILDIETFPKLLRGLIEGLAVEELNWKYRPDGWSIKQVVHHCSDSHLNSIIRFKWTLTEDTPTIKAYFEDRWAELPDSQDDDLTLSLNLIDSLHSKWVRILRSLTDNQLERTFFHPESQRHIGLKENIGIYAWHCNHHLAHIEQALAAKGKYN